MAPSPPPAIAFPQRFLAFAYPHLSDCDFGLYRILKPADKLLVDKRPLICNRNHKKSKGRYKKAGRHFPAALSCFRLFSAVFSCFLQFSAVFSCFLMFSAFPSCFQLLPDVSCCCQLIPAVSCCFQLFPAFFFTFCCFWLFSAVYSSF